MFCHTTHLIQLHINSHKNEDKRTREREREKTHVHTAVLQREVYTAETIKSAARSQWQRVEQS